jgi:AcrR family transcriptional regulator
LLILKRDGGAPGAGISMKKNFAEGRGHRAPPFQVQRRFYRKGYCLPVSFVSRKELGVRGFLGVFLTEPASPFRSAEQRREERAAKRETVLRAAVQMFNSQGFHATSLDDVAASLGISKPTIYHYLGNKDQVLLECVTIGLRQLLEAAERARSGTGRGIDRLRDFLRRYAEINMDDFGRCVIRTGEEALSPESRRKFRSLKKEINDAMRALIEEGVADGSIAPVDPKLLSFVLAGALNWPARWFAPDGEQDAKALAGQLVGLLEGGFSPR